jgi:hypothetical protein
MGHQKESEANSDSTYTRTLADVVSRQLDMATAPEQTDPATLSNATLNKLSNPHYPCRSFSFFTRSKLAIGNLS